MTRPALPPTAGWRTPRVLDVAAVSIAVTAVLVLLVPSRGPEGSSTRRPAQSLPTAATMQVARDTSADAAAWRATVIAGNLFSAARRAPLTPFVAPGTTLAAPLSPSPEPPSGAGPITTTDALPHLSGIVARDGVWYALLQLTEADGGPRLYRVGERHATYTIRAITATAVLLTGPSGTQRLSLRTRAAQDSSPTSP